MNLRAWFDNLRTDVKLAVRSLRRTPGFTAVALLALTVGMGGTTAIFSVIDATRTQAIPYREPHELVYLIGTARRATVERRGASYLDFLDWRAQVTRICDIGTAAYDGRRRRVNGVVGADLISGSSSTDNKGGRRVGARGE
jgi:hypothetical protein